MKYTPLLLLTLLLAGCNERSDPGTLAHGMKWTIAQRELEQNGWTNTVSKIVPRAVNAEQGGKAYRYVNAKGVAIDFITERVGEIEKIDRIFDGNSREIEALSYK